MRRVEVLPDAAKLSLTPERRQRLADWLFQEIEAAKSARASQESAWTEAMRLYEGVPKTAQRNIPIPNAPNLTVPLAGTATDEVYASTLDLIFQVDPPVTARPAHGDEYEEAADALQVWINHSLETRWYFREGMEDALLDCCQLGSGFVYVPFEKDVVVTRTTRVRQASPRVRAIAPEDFFVPGGARSLNSCSWVAIRSYLSKVEMEDRARVAKWEYSDAQLSTQKDNRVLHARQRLGRTQEPSSMQSQQTYEIFEVFCTFDVNEDGAAEDLYVVFEPKSRTLLKVRWNPYDRRPVANSTYQRRGHLLYGIGIPEQLGVLQDTASEILCFWLVNMLLANARAWVTPPGTLSDDETIWPGRVLESSNPDAIKGLAMADVYQSAPQAVSIIMGMAERRSGTGSLASPKPGQMVGNRTPGITALTLTQQVQRRFVSAFDSMRLMGAEAVRQCLYREQERLLAGDKNLAFEIQRVLGEKKGNLVINLLRESDFAQQVVVELTAGSASVNREADKQNAILLMDRLFPYYEKYLSLSQIAYAPQGQVPPEMQQIAQEILKKGSKLVLDVVKNFDVARNPEGLLLGLGEMDGTMGDGAGGPPGGLEQLLGLLGGTPQGAAGGIGAGGEPGGNPQAPGPIAGEQ